MQSTTLKDFEVIKKLGDGSFSQVYQVLRHSDSQLYALKNVKLGFLKSKEKENALNEVRILASITHPNIVPYKEALYDEGSNSLCIIMELVSGGTLSHLIDMLKKSGSKLDESVIWSYINQMLKGLKALHDLKILHRDLKSANIFLTEDQKTLKIADMNVSKVAKGGFLHTQTGTPYYASPEIWRCDPYNAKSDIWSLGCVLYEICALKPPFVSTDKRDLFQKIQYGNFNRIPSHYSDQLQKIVMKCLSRNPNKRPSVEGLLKMIGENRKIVEKNEDLLRGYSQYNFLMKTLKFPKNPKSLVDILPKPNYQEKKKLSMFHGNAAVALSRDREFIDGILPIIENKPLRKIVRKKSKVVGDNKENMKPQVNNNVKMPKIKSRSRSPNILEEKV